MMKDKAKNGKPALSRETGSIGLDACFNSLASEQTPLALAIVVQTAQSTSGMAGHKALVSADGIVEG